MSGLAAVVKADATAPPDEASRDAMLRAMPHRGEHRFVQATRGVAIAGRSRRADFAASSKTVHVAIDGQIHNLDELELSEDVPAAQAVLTCYERWGTDAVARLVGDFAFVLHDTARGLFLAARDALGMRPLYLHRDGDDVFLASEAQALVAAGLDAQPNPLALALFIAGEYQEEGYTLRKGIEALPPGSYFVADRSGIAIRRYWQPDPWRKLDVDLEEAAHLIGSTFGEAVRCRLPEDNHHAVVLSGGLDSASVACQVASLSQAPLALHCSLEGWDSDETPICRAITSKWAMPSLMVTGGGEQMLAATSPEPRSHPDDINIAWGACFVALLDEAQRAGIQSAMTGLGGDQVTDENGNECIDALRAGALREVGAITGLSREPLSRQPYRRLWAAMRGAVPETWRFATTNLRHRRTPMFLSPRWGKQVVAHLDLVRARRLQRSWPDATSARMCELLDEYGIRVGVPQATLVGALRGIDVSHPFLDQRLFELALALPRQVRARNGWRKRKPALRHAMAELLPDEVTHRRDAAEFSSWMRDAYLRFHRKRVADLFRDSRLAELGVIDPRAVQAAFDENLPTSPSIIAFGLVSSMELWLRQEWS